MTETTGLSSDGVEKGLKKKYVKVNEVRSPALGPGRTLAASKASSNC